MDADPQKSEQIASATELLFDVSPLVVQEAERQIVLVLKKALSKVSNI
jgi:hypothetical protein